MGVLLGAIALLIFAAHKRFNQNSGSGSATGTIISFTPLFNRPMAMRNDAAGQGHYGATRNGHVHQGLDIICTPGEYIYAPVNAVVNRWFYVYEGDKRFTGIELIAAYNMVIKLMYVTPMPGKVSGGKLTPYGVNAGDPCGIMQNRSITDASMKPHVHIEVIQNGKHIDPLTLIKLS